jgi:hypothetical protein
MGRCSLSVDVSQEKCTERNARFSRERKEGGRELGGEGYLRPSMKIMEPLPERTPAANSPRYCSPLWYLYVWEGRWCGGV